MTLLVVVVLFAVLVLLNVAAMWRIAWLNRTYRSLDEAVGAEM